MVNTRMLAWPSYTDLFAAGPRRLSRKDSERPLMPFGMALRGPLPRGSSDSYDTALLLSRKIGGGRVPLFLWSGASSHVFAALGEGKSLPEQDAQGQPLQEEIGSPWFPRWNAAKRAYGQSFHFDAVSLAPYSFCA